MFTKTATSLKDKKEQLMQSYEKIGDSLVFKRVDSRKKIKDLQGEISDLRQLGITVIFLTNEGQVTHLAPGVDPYQVRKRIDAFLQQEAKEANEASKKSSKKSTTNSTVKTSSKYKVEDLN